MAFPRRQPALKGVNLGGWLVLEKWMAPSLFAATDAVDEFTFCDRAGPERLKRLKAFRRRWITEADFKWLRAHGIQVVRIPVGYWLFGGEPPYVGTVDFLDKAFVWAGKYGIKVLVCLHGAPGSQNGHDHSGRVGAVGWGQGDSVAQTLEVVAKLATRYGGNPALLGFELLNEPSSALPKRLLKQYYRQAYRLIRRQCGRQPWVVFSDRFQLGRWSWSLHWPLYRRAFLDTHQYQVFTERDKALDVAGHIRQALAVGQRLGRLAWHRQVIVGEWSAALDPQSLAGLDAAGQCQASRRYMAAQRAAYGRADAWFYWSYKTEAGGAWSYRAMMQAPRLGRRL